MQTKSIPYTFYRGDYYLEPNCQMGLGFIGKSALAQTGSAVNKDSHKDVENVW